MRFAAAFRELVQAKQGIDNAARLIGSYMEGEDAAVSEGKASYRRHFCFII